MYEEPWSDIKDYPDSHRAALETELKAEIGGDHVVMGSGLASCTGLQHSRPASDLLKQGWLHNEVGYIKIHNIEAVGSGHQFPKVDVRWEL